GQLEQASFASSYIPTTTATVARANEGVQGVALPITGLTGSGTMLAEVERSQFSASEYIWQLRDAATAQISQYSISSTGRITGNASGYDSNAAVNATAGLFSKGATAFGATDTASAQAGSIGGFDDAVTLPGALTEI